MKHNGVGVGTVLEMDNFEYKYLTNPNGEPSNRLDQVKDDAENQTYYEDIKQTGNGGQNAGNYKYNNLGQLVKDENEHISAIYWRFGDKKVKRIVKDDLNGPELEFVYNPFGQRILKIVKLRFNGQFLPQNEWFYTYYTYDANGQVMATYDLIMSDATPANNKATLNELSIYGSSRIGLKEANKVLFANGNLNVEPTDGIINNELGTKRYEITNQLGNVNVVITDRKMRDLSAGASSVFVAVDVMTSDYYPFGMLMPGRNMNSSDFRYGYQNQEVDNEIKGIGKSINFEYRMHDPRVGRFFALDPIKDKYPYNSPYAFSENRVIDGVELEGLEVFLIHGTMMYRSDKMFTDETVNQFKRIGGNTKVNKSFSWGSNTWDFGLANMANSRYIERVIATRLLVRHVVNVRKEMLKNGEITMAEPITLVGYSNGGHLSIRAADEIERQTGVKVQIITYATPAFNDGSVEDPSMHSGIKKHYHFYSEGDRVDDIVEADETYNNSFTINYKIPSNVIKHNNTPLIGGGYTHMNMGDIAFNKKLGSYLQHTVGSMKYKSGAIGLLTNPFKRDNIKGNNSDSNQSTHKPRHENESSGPFNSQK